jgi:hypothetical protein
MSRQSRTGILTSNGNLPSVSPVTDFPAPLEETLVVKLDTGRVVKMVVAELSMLYEAGEIPDELTPIASRALFPAGKEDEREREHSYRERLRLAKWVAGRVLRNPVVVDNPKGGNEITIGRLYHDEIWQIYGLANSPVEALRNFRRQQASHVGAAPEVQAVQPTAE